MFAAHMFGLLYHPKNEWSFIRRENYSLLQVYLRYAIFLALIPPVSLFIGTTQYGWSIAGGDVVKLTTESALPIAILFYFSLLVGLAFVSYCTFWMEKTFGADASFERCLIFTTFTATPMFLYWFTAYLVAGCFRGTRSRMLFLIFIVRGDSYFYEYS